MAILPHGDQNIPLGGADPSTDAGAAHQMGPEVCREREVGPKHGGRGGRSPCQSEPFLQAASGSEEVGARLSAFSS